MRIATAVISISLCVGTIQAQGIVGTEFMFCIPMNFRDKVSINESDSNPVSWPAPHIYGVITSRQSGDVRIESMDNLYRTIVHVAPNQPGRFEIPTDVVLSQPNEATYKTISMSATTAVSVAITYYKFQTTESFSVLPTTYYGKEFVAVSYNGLNEALTGFICITSTEDGTNVSVKSAPSDPAPFNTTYTLNKGQSVRVLPKHWKSDLTGARVTSTKPVSVLTGHTCAYVPEKVDACNYLIEHLPPTTMMGTTVVVPTIPFRKMSRFRLVAIDDETIVGYGTNNHVLNAGQFIEATSDNSKPIVVTSTKRIIGALYSTGFSSGDSIGDPSVVLLPHNESWQLSTRIGNPLTKVWNPQIVIVTTRSAVSTLQVNGAAIPDSTLINYCGDYAQVTLPLTSSEAQVTCGSPMEVFLFSQTKDDNAYDGWSQVCTWGR